MHDLAIIIVSTNESHWIRALLPTVFAHLGDISADVVVVDNDSRDGIADVVADEFPEARTVWSANHGFGHANNRGLMTCNARYVLFLNPDTEILEGTFAELVRLMDERPTVGLVGCRQIIARGRLAVHDGPLLPERAARTRRRAVCRAAAWAPRPSWLGEREIDPDAYEREFDCDWTTGRSCSPAARRSRAPAASTSASSCTPRRPISAAGSRRLAGRSGTCRR